MNEHIPVFILNELIILPSQEIKIDVANDVSKRVIKNASKNNLNKVLVIAPRNVKEVSPSLSDFPSVGVIAQIKSKLELSNGTMRIVLRGLERVEITNYFQSETSEILKCSVKEIMLPEFDKNKKNATIKKLKSLIKKYVEMDGSVSNSILNNIKDNNDLNSITDMIASFIELDFTKKLAYMEMLNPLKRAEALIEDLSDEIELSSIDKELEEKLSYSLENGQREYILKEKLKEINKELGNSREDEINLLISKLDSLKLSEISYNKILNEIHKYSSSSEYSPESSVLKNYIDTILNLPWNESSSERLDPLEVNMMLNEEHYGLDDIKYRIMEYVSLKSSNPSLRSPILCLIGPPGVGKTTIAMSISKALNRKFYKMSVGGLNDSTELIGSRRTYLGALPGKIMQGIIKSGVNNPVILIDEIDKMVKDYKGDPAATLLEVLDESQNKSFMDNYIEEPFDLSNVFFILTANNESDIPPMLLDRLEIFYIHSYDLIEKEIIAQNFLLKEVNEKYNASMKINKDVIDEIILDYTKEPGVRELRRILDKLIRKVLVYEKDVKLITSKLVKKYLDNEVLSYLPEIKDAGVVNILAYTTMGGQISHVEVVRHKGEGKITITGQAGDVLKESIMVCSSYLESHYGYDISKNDIHVHFLSSSQKKDGPSAGIAIAVAILSLFEKKVIPNEVAFTGELNLKGDILPIGGLKEKLNAAYFAGIKCVYVPKANEIDLKSVPASILNTVNVKLVSNFSEIYESML